MAKKRVTRKQLLKQPDEFITTTGRLISWARENTRALVWGAGIFIGVVLVISAYGIFRADRASKAQALLSRAMVKYQAQAGDDQAAKALAAAQADFDILLKSYARQPAGRLGRIIFGHYCLAAEAYDDAVENYQVALEEFKKEPSLANVIMNGLASAHQQKGEYAQAMNYYKQIAAGTDSMLQDAALFNLGSLHAQMGQTAEREEVFGRLLTDFPDSFYAGLVRK